MAETIVLNINTNGTAIKNINDLKASIADLQKQSESLDLGSEAFTQAREQLSAYQTQLRQVSQTQEQLDATAEAAAERHSQHIEKLGNDIQKFAQGTTDAFAGAFIAFGAGADTVDAVNAKFQKGIGIAVGLKGGIEALVAGFQLAVPAIELFNTALAANPVGVIIAGIVALTAGIYLLVKAFDDSTDSVKSSIAFIQKQQEILTTKYDNEIALAKAAGQTTAELEVAKNKATIDNINSQIAEYQKLRGLENGLNKDEEKEYEDLQAKKFALVVQANANILASEKALNDSIHTISELAYTSRLSDQGKQIEAINVEAEARKKAQQDTYDTAKANGATTLQDYYQNQAALTAIDQVAAIERGKIYNADAKAKADALAQATKDVEGLTAATVKLTTDANKEAVSDIATTITDTTDTVVQAQDTLSQSVNKTLDTLADGADASAPVLENAFNKIGGAAGQLGASMTSAFQSSFDALADDSASAADKVEAVGNTVASTLNSIDQYVQAQAQQKEKNLTASLNNQLTAVKNNAQAQTTALQQAQAKELANHNLTQAQKDAINTKYANLEAANQNKAALDTYKLQLDSYNKETAIKKQAFETNKKLSIATAIISTITGALAAFNSLAVIPIVGDILGAAAAAAVAVSGALQVSQIQSTTFDAGSPPTAPNLTPVADPSSLSSAASSPAATTASSTSMNYAQNGPNLYTTDNATSSNGTPLTGGRMSSNQPVRAYVVATDITSVQDKNALISRRASF